MKLRTQSIYAIIMLCAPFMAEAGLQELKNACDQAELAVKAAIENARAYFENYQIEYDAALELQEKAEYESYLAMQTYVTACLCLDALNQDCERSEDDEAFLKEVERELEEEEHNAKHKLAMNEMLTIADALDADVTATLTWQDGRETDQFGVLRIHNDGRVTFVGKPTHTQTPSSTSLQK
jgi:ADP-glucose pyrophosphorylase